MRQVNENDPLPILNGAGVLVAVARCRTCRWWAADEPGCDPNCLCEHPKLCNPRTDQGSDALNYEYDEGGGFFTGPDFGCVHWEGR
jgi:hypothetical protein